MSGNTQRIRSGCGSSEWLLAIGFNGFRLGLWRRWLLQIFFNAASNTGFESASTNASFAATLVSTACNLQHALIDSVTSVLLWPSSLGDADRARGCFGFYASMEPTEAEERPARGHRSGLFAHATNFAPTNDSEGFDVELT